MRSIHRLCAGVLASAFLSSFAAGQNRIETLFASNNGGAVGGSVYFDVTVTHPSGIVITGLDINTSAPPGTRGTVEVYTTPGSHVGQEQNPPAWSLLTVANLGSSGQDGVSSCALDTQFSLPAGAVGVAVCAQGIAHRYFDGTGTNQSYADANLRIDLGAAQNGCFSGSVTSPRVANIAFDYYLPKQVSLTGQFPAVPGGTANVTGVDYDTILEQLWTVDPSSRLARSYNPVGTLLASHPVPAPVGATASDPQCCAFDPGSGYLWIYDGAARRVHAMAPDGSATGTDWPVSAALNVKDMTYADDTRTLMLLAEVGGSTTPSPRIVEFDLNGNLLGQRPIASTFDPDGLAYEHVTESYFVSSSSNGEVVEFNRAGTTFIRHTLALGSAVQGMALNGKQGNLYFALAAGVGTGGPDIPLPWAPGSITLTGPGCLDSWGVPPAQTSNGCAKIGRPMRLTTVSCAAVTSYALGFQPAPAPIDLTIVGAPGCALYQPMDFVSPPQMTNGFRTSFELPIPNDPFLIGARIYNQAINLPDIGANALGVSVSNGCVIEIQR